MDNGYVHRERYKDRHLRPNNNITLCGRFEDVIGRLQWKYPNLG